MPASYSVLFAMLVAIPAVLIPLYIIGRMRHVLVDERRDAGDRWIARGTIVVMVVLLVFGLYAALAIYTTLNAVAGR